MRELLADANILLRFLAQDDDRQSPAATDLFASAAAGRARLHVDALAVAEAIYVLGSEYNRSRNDISDVLLALFNNPGIALHDENLLRGALVRYSKTNIDFPDALLAARAAQSTWAVASFDRDFDKFKDVTRFDPARHSL